MASSPTHGRCVLPASCRPGPVLLHPAPEAEKPSLRGGKRAPNASSPTQRAARTRPAAEQPQLPPVLPMPARQGGKKDDLPLLQLARVLLAMGRGQGGQERVGRSAGQGRVPGESHDRCISGLGHNMPSNPHMPTRPACAGPHPALVSVHRTRVMDLAT